MDKKPARKTKKVDTTDSSGKKKRVLLPEGETDVTRGIPLSFQASEYLETYDTSEFLETLDKELQARGLIEADDYAGNSQSILRLIQEAVRSAYKIDAMKIYTAVKGQIK